jgi:hypothetical protein
MEEKKSKGKSAFGRQKIVETGLVRNVCSSVWLFPSDGRVWIGSSVKSCSGVLGQVSVVAFERDSILEEILDWGFSESELQSVFVPYSVVVLGKKSFRWCKSLESVTFESGSQLERIEESAFQWSGLKSIEMPSSVVVLGKWSFRGCKSLECVTFESGSRLERIEESAFSGSGLKSIEIPGSVTFIDGSSFARLALNPVSVSPDSMRFRLRECLLEAFDGSTIYR